MESTLISAAVAPSPMFRILEGALVVVGGCWGAAVTDCPATVVGVSGGGGGGMLARLKGVDPHGSSTVMVLEDVPPPGQVLTSIGHWGSSRLALGKRGGGSGGVGWDDDGEEPGDCVVGGQASGSGREGFDVGAGIWRESIIDDGDPGRGQNLDASRIGMSYRPR